MSVNKKSSLVGFKANVDELKMVGDILDDLKKQNPDFADKITVSDVLRKAVTHLHLELFMKEIKSKKSNKKSSGDPDVK